MLFPSFFLFLENSETEKPKFQWCDGIFLSAIKEGAWVILDEMNLAPQPVLEGLNSVLDHRGTVFIPELNQEFKCPPTFRVFGCQNPTNQGESLFFQFWLIYFQVEVERAYQNPI